MTDEQDKKVPVDALAVDVRDALEKLRSAGRTSEILKTWCDDGIEALAALQARASQAEADRDNAIAAFNEVAAKADAFEAELASVREVTIDMARLLIDMADALALTRGFVPKSEQIGVLDLDALLARFADLDTKAGGAQ